MNKRHFVLSVFPAIIAAMLFVSCAEKGPVGPVGDPGAGAITLNLQNGVYPDASYAGCEDTRIRNGASAANNYGGAINMQLGYDGSDVKRGMIRFDLSAVPAGARITNAYLTLYCSGVVNAAASYAVHKAITNSWVELQATWNIYSTGNNWTTAGGDYDAGASSNIVSVGTAAQYYTWDLSTSLVQGWVDAPASNLGVFLTSQTEAEDRGNTFLTSENATTALRPRLTVYYTAP